MLRDGGGERRTAGADLASKPGLGARSAAGGGEVPPARGARARLAALVLGGEERRGEGERLDGGEGRADERCVARSPSASDSSSSLFRVIGFQRRTSLTGGIGGGRRCTRRPSSLPGCSH